MPAWWGKKSSSKNKSNKDGDQEDKKKKVVDKKVISSFDESGLAGIRTSSSSGFSGFDSDRKGHPLPQPVMNTTTSGFDVSGSVSSSGGDSSVSSSAAPDDQFRGYGDAKVISQPRSPGPGSRVATTTTSPRHPRFAGSSLETPNKRIEEGHPLPLPPTSPTSPPTRICNSPSRPSIVPNVKNAENASCQLSKWKKGRLLGRGTFGHVYLGFNSESGQMCAIKEVKVVGDDQSSKESLKQLNQEITLLSHLSHPKIVQYYGSELGEEALSVYLEYVSGGSIHKLLQEYGPFREPVIQNYTRQVLCGLAYLHGRNTVHRDIKGANILVDPNGEIKLADFGMAKHITNCTSMLSFKGSPYWMAPEVVMNTNGYNLAVDIWSLGCTILEMATSKPPWGQYEGVAAIFKIGNSRDMPDIPDHLSNDAKSFIKQCLQRDPSLRPTASKLLDHPFVRDQATTRVANVNLTKKAFPSAFDGSHTRAASEMHPNRNEYRNARSFEVMGSKGAMFSPRQPQNARTITSLPVSPTSSPLRQNGPFYNSCFLSPPHPSYSIIGQSNHPLRSNAKKVLDPWYEIPQHRPQTPNRSPRTQLI